MCVCVCTFSVFRYSLELLLVYLLYSFFCFPHTSSLLADCWFILRQASLKVTLWNRPRVEKLIVSCLVNIFSAFYRIRRFITVLTAACHLSVSWARWIHFTLFHPLLRLLYTLPTLLLPGLRNRLSRSGFGSKTFHPVYVQNAPSSSSSLICSS